MSDGREFDEPRTYQIVVKGGLDEKWSDWFEDLTVIQKKGATLLVGRVRDQCALHGLLARIRDLGLPLLMLKQLDEKSEDKKMMKLLFKFLAVTIAMMIGGILGLIVGAYIGGNYVVDFTFNGVGGYEASSQLGFLIGSIVGGVFCWLILFKTAEINHVSHDHSRVNKNSIDEKK